MPDNIRMVRQGTSYTDPVASSGNERQLVTVDATAGTFTLTYAGQTTTAIAEAAAAAAVQSALEALSNIGVGDVAVTGAAGGPWTVEFTGVFAGTDVALMTGSGALLTGGAATVVITTPGVAFSSPVSLSWGTGDTAVREVVYAPATGRTAQLQREITSGNIEETTAGVTTKPTTFGLIRVKLSRKLAIPPQNGDILTYSSATGLWVPETNK